MKTSVNGLDFLAKQEGLILHPYLDSAGVATIGVGSTFWEDGTPVKIIDPPITRERAIELFKNNLRNFEVTVSMTTKNLNQNQFDAVVSLCPSPETKILKSNLEWVSAGDIIAGDKLFAFEENVNGGNRRRLRPVSIVNRVKTIISERVRVVTDLGDIIVSPDHLFLAKNPRHSKSFSWIPATKLTNKWEIPHLFFQEKSTKDAGWLSGIFDGEGHLGRIGAKEQKSPIMGFSQKGGLVLDRAISLMNEMGYSYQQYTNKTNDVRNISSGNIKNILKMLCELRPVRLIPKIEMVFSDSCFFSFDKAKVITIEKYSPGEVVMIDTDEKTYFANGFTSHNCYNIGEGAFRISTVRAKILSNPNDKEGITKGWLMWSKIRDSKTKELVFSKALNERRKRELGLYFS